MRMLLGLSALAIQPLVSAASRLLSPEVGLAAIDAVSGFLIERFANHSAHLTDALARANSRAWKSLEFALAGDSLLDLVARGDDRAFRAQLRGFLASVRLDGLPGDAAEFRARCLEELRAARGAGLLDQGPLDVESLAREAGRFAQFADPAALLEAEARAVCAAADSLPTGRYPHLVRLLRLRPAAGSPVLVAAARYFFRREVSQDEGLSRELTFARLESLREGQEEGFAGLAAALTDHGGRLDEALSRLDGRLGALSGQVQELAAAVGRLLEGRQLARRPLRPADSLSYSSDAEFEFIRDVVARYRALPADQRRRWPELLGGIGKLEMVAGSFGDAGRDFGELAAAAVDPEMQAEAHHGAYLAALEERDWAAALRHLAEAGRLDAGRFAPFPADKYEPERVLGAGGFGVAFLCRDRDLGRRVVVKALLAENLDRDSEVVFAEARALERVEHPAVVRLVGCDYADRASRRRPYLVMEYFDGAALDDHVRRSGPLTSAEFLAVARPVAEAIKAAHRAGVVHRDVKPGNVLVRQEAAGWQVRLIDFGLALGEAALRAAGDGRSLAGRSAAGTMEYSAPEQLGRLAGVAVGPPSDVYAFARTCCFALFGTPQPLRRHWAELPPHLAELLEACLADNPAERPRDFTEVLRGLEERHGGAEAQAAGRVLEHFERKIGAGISRSPLLKVAVGRSARLLDISRLAGLHPDLPGRLVATVLGGGGPLALDLRSPTGSGQAQRHPAAELAHSVHDLLDRKVRRQAELAKREVGVHALWLGYPLLYAATGSGPAGRWALAPLFLWPVTIEPDSRLERHLRVGRCVDPDAARFNRVLALWVKRELGVDLRAPDEEEVQGLGLEDLRACLPALATQFAAEVPDVRGPLVPVPDRESLQMAGGTRLIHAAVLGYFRWHNEAVLADLEAIRERGDVRGVAAGFAAAARLPQSAEVQAPAETDRHLVSEADFSQERVVWQARTGPGLVVHGPPGTGKSQTIVNIVADALARRETVLMVCQKQAATRVVLERLRAAGLGDLCLEVHDAELDRLAVFRAVRGQVDRLQPAASDNAHRERERLARQIDALEGELDRQARALHQPHPRVGISYLRMADQEQLAYREFPSVRPLPSLQRALGGLSAESVEEVCRRAREVGRWFAEADPLRSRWRYARLDSFRPSAATRADIGAALAVLRARDEDHQAVVRLGGPGTPLPANLHGFAEAAAEAISGLSLPANASHPVLAWLRELRGGEEAARRAEARCREALSAADEIGASRLDPYWEATAASDPNFTAVAEDVTRRLDEAANGAGPGDGLTLPWLRALRGRGKAVVEEAEQRCRAAEELARQAALASCDPGWEEALQTPDLPGALTPVLERMEDLAGRTNTGTITRCWLPLVRGAGPARLEGLRDRCRRAIALAHKAARMPEPPGWLRGLSVAETDDAERLLGLLSRLREGGEVPAARLTLCWLRELRQVDEAELQRRLDACQRAGDLARVAADSHADPAWDVPCAGKTQLELTVLRVQAEEYLLRSGRWLRLLDGAFRRSRRTLLRLRPDASEEALPALAESLAQYVEAMETRGRAVAALRSLLPADAPDTWRASPLLPLNAMREAAWVLRLARRPWCAAVLDEALGAWGRQGAAEESLQAHLKSLPLRRDLAEANKALVPGITPRDDAQVKYPPRALEALEQAAWLAGREEEYPWLAGLVEAFAQHKGPGPLPALAAARRCLSAYALRAQLAGANRYLVSGHDPGPGAGGSHYTAIAVAGLREAVSLLRVEVHGWATALVKELLAGGPPHARERLKRWLRLRRLRDNLAVLGRSLLPGAAPSVDTEGQVEFVRSAWRAFQGAERLRALAQAHPWLDPLLEDAVTPGREGRLRRGLAELEQTLRRHPALRALLEALAQFKPYLHDQGLREPYRAARAGEPVTPWADALEAGFDGLQALACLETDRRGRAGPVGEALAALEEYEHCLAAGAPLPAPPAGLSLEGRGRWWAALVACSAAVAWQDRCRQEFPEITQLTPDGHAAKARQLGELLARKRALEAQVIRERWLALQLPHKNEPWSRLLQERNSKLGSGKRLREAVEGAWDRGLPALRPCWLVNPAAASQIFPLQPGLFDLVIFDEASQCPVEQAVPAIYRGKRLVVCGDEKQLPPTAFFAAAAEGDDGDLDDTEADESPAEAVRRRQRRADEEHLTQAADLLEAAIGRLKQLYLSVHYRSDHPALIEFSNRAFYDGQLEAPPPRCDAGEAGPPIEYIAVGGRYADRTNPEEARRVVEVVRQFWLGGGPSPTLGVVTFNQAQQDLIEDLLEGACRADGVLDSRHREERDRREGGQDVGFFVKNLESVQGDERDVMVFSTTFGPDAQGRFFRRFGPVGAAGGHRRLNVAVTRARRRVIVVGSMPVAKVAGALTGGAGSPLTPAGYLQLYLAYAEAVASGGDVRALLDRLGPSRQVTPGVEPETTLEADVRAVLEAQGYLADRGVGGAGFQVGLAVRRREPSGGYLLGVECDGGGWSPTRPPRVHDVWRLGVLAARGWRLHRIWGPNWWADRDVEVRRLQAALREV